MAVLGLAAVAGATLVRPAAALRAAQSARSFLLWARLEAMWTGRAVAVTIAGDDGLQARSVAASDGADPLVACQGPVRRRLDLASFGAVRISRPLRAGLVWLPGGGARSCNGGGVISGTLVLTDARGHAEVIVSSLGRIRIEAGP